MLVFSNKQIKEMPGYCLNNFKMIGKSSFYLPCFSASITNKWNKNFCVDLSQQKIKIKKFSNLFNEYKKIRPVEFLNKEFLNEGFLSAHKLGKLKKFQSLFNACESHKKDKASIHDPSTTGLAWMFSQQEYPLLTRHDDLYEHMLNVVTPYLVPEINIWEEGAGNLEFLLQAYGACLEKNFIPAQLIASDPNPDTLIKGLAAASCLQITDILSLRVGACGEKNPSNSKYIINNSFFPSNLLILSKDLLSILPSKEIPKFFEFAAAATKPGGLVLFNCQLTEGEYFQEMSNPITRKTVWNQNLIQDADGKNKIFNYRYLSPDNNEFLADRNLFSNEAIDHLIGAHNLKIIKENTVPEYDKQVRIILAVNKSNQNF